MIITMKIIAKLCKKKHVKDKLINKLSYELSNKQKN